MSTDDPLERRRAARSRQRRNRLILLGGLVALVCAGGVGAGVAWNRKQVAEGRPGLLGGGQEETVAKWTYKDMAAHLNKNGLPGWEYQPYKGRALLISPSSRYSGEALAAVLDAILDNGLEWPSDVVLIEKGATTEAVRQAAGHTNRSVVAFHNWLILADEKTVATLRQRLR